MARRYSKGASKDVASAMRRRKEESLKSGRSGRTVEAGERISEVNEIVLSKDGKVAAVVIGVGGLLGMGEHEVVAKFESLRVTRTPTTTPLSR
jgi:Family of unknown function (DUF6496)/PRC-barrel domain